ncbi:hypothetical protein A3768_1955 [Ralstonia solanacearum]|nr:hypothetical protein A3768_1955 [Ralstonia solanacearum]
MRLAGRHQYRRDLDLLSLRARIVTCPKSQAGILRPALAEQRKQ